MENLQNLRFCPWISASKFNLKTYFDEYKSIVNDVFKEEQYGNPIPFKNFIKDRQSFLNPDEKDLDLLGQSGSENAIDSIDLEQLEKDCSIDLLSVEDELKPESLPEGPTRLASELTSLYAGGFSDGVIPEGKTEKLETLRNQAEELVKRAVIPDYGKLRYRMLKYHNTIRILTDSENLAIPIQTNKELPLQDIVLNVRIQRPFHRKTHYKKSSNRYPSHSQELLVLGSQPISDLKDMITCINDLAVHRDFSNNPDINQLLNYPNGAKEFPSAFIYIDGIFYSDFRDERCEDHSKEIREWAKRYPEIGELKVEDMSKVTFQDLTIRLGYPYVYIHQGICEHLVTFSDVRMHHSEDVRDPSKYPVTRGQSLKYSVQCYACGLHVANWIVQNDSRIPVPNAHFCDKCLKYFCYDSRNKKVMDIKVYPFFNEFQTEQKDILARDKETEAKLIAAAKSSVMKKRGKIPKCGRGRARKRKR